MGKRIIWLCLLLVAIGAGYSYYKHHQDELRLANGDVNCDGCMTPEEHERYLKGNSSPSGGGQNDASGTDQQDANGETTVSAAQMTAPAGKSAGTAMVAGTGTGTGMAAGTPARAAVGTGMAGANGMDTPPAGDTIAPNPPNGMVFAGKGTYQWYRQGNLTWRVDTASGRSCIVYATMEEWRKQIVYSHGCGRNA